MNIKERLEQLDYSDAYDLWSVWILGNQEPPDKWLIVHELSDLAAMDADAAQKLSDEIDKLLAEDEIHCVDCGCEISSGLLCRHCGSKEVTFAEAGTDLSDYRPIIISIRGGCIYAVDNVPSDKTVEVRDYDIESYEDLHTDSDGEQYSVSFY